MIFKRKCKITFICHGATINTEENRQFDDETYPALNGLGKLEMQKISDWVKNKGLQVDNIYSSPSLRTTQSARIISQGFNKDFEVIESLRSKRTGIWSGYTFDEIEEKYPETLDAYHKDPEYFCPEGGESVYLFNKRVGDTIDEIIEKNISKRIIIVTHKEVIQSAIAKTLEIPVRNEFKVIIPTGSATQISYFKGFSQLLYSSYVPV